MARPFKHPRSGVYWFRKAVPQDLRGIIGKTEINKTLDTKDAAVARTRHAEIAVTVEREWQEHRRRQAILFGPMLEEVDKETIARAGKVYYAALLEEDGKHMCDKDALPQQPTQDADEVAYRTARATVGVVPFAGTFLQELMDVAIGSPLEKRRANWYRSLAVEVARLKEQSESFDSHLLAGKPEFVSAVYEATTIAMKTHHQEKLGALRNAVLNSALDPSHDEVLRGRFFGYVDRFSPTHIRMLKILHEPFRHSSMSDSSGRWQGNVIKALAATVPELKDETLISLLLGELQTEGLVKDTLALDWDGWSVGAR